MNRGIIHKSMSPWESPTVVVKKHKPEGSPQQSYLCINYRKLNSLLPATMCTKKGTLSLMPLPKIAELFTLLKGAKYFTALDLCSGYYDITFDEESIPKSAFTTVFDKLKFLRFPFSLSQGPVFFIGLFMTSLDSKRLLTKVKVQEIWLICTTS